VYGEQCPRIPEHIVLENVVPKILIECLHDTGHLFQIACCHKWKMYSRYEDLRKYINSRVK
jgi:hypothetical protein